MPKIEVWKCPKTKKNFFGREEYREHILALRTRINEQRAWDRERKLIRERVWYAIENISSPKVLAEYVKKHFHDIMIAYNGASPRVAEAIREIVSVDFKFSNVHYSENCSNSHHAPRDGVRNWGRKEEGKPTGYPGFSARLKFIIENVPNSSDERLKVRGSGGSIISIDISRALEYIGIRTTGGSYNRHNGEGSYGVTFFLSDFRAMKKAYFHAKLEDRDFMEA